MITYQVRNEDLCADIKIGHGTIVSGISKIGIGVDLDKEPTF